MRRPVRPSVVRAIAAVLLAALVCACSPGALDDGDGPRAWRGLELVVPNGWTVLDERADLLLIANEDIRVDDIDAEPSFPDDRNSNDVVAVQMIAGQSIGPDDWRELVEEEGGRIEGDEQITVGGLPATSITYRWVSNDVPVRERVVLVASRDLYLLLAPVPIEGQTNGPEVYDRHTDEFAAILESIEFGRPVEG